MPTPRHGSERIYAILLRIYPPRFRAGYGTDAVELFRDQCREARSTGGFLGLARLWARTLPNVILHGFLEWRLELSRQDAASVLKHAARRIGRAPAPSAMIVATLGVAIGANVALFSVVRGVLLRPLPYPDADQLVRIWERNPQVDDQLHGPSPLNFADWARAHGGFASMAAWYLTSGTFRTELGVEEVRSAQVTPDFFRVLGVPPMLGRDFRAEEVVRYGPIMLSHRMWQRMFGGDPDVVGRTVTASGNAYEIAGVMPPDFRFPDESVEAWIAWNLPAVYADRPEARSWRFLNGIGRLRAGTSMRQAEDGLDGLAAGLAAAYPIVNGGWDTAVTSLYRETVGDVRATLWIAFGAAFLVLLVACANVANLLLSRAPARGREIRIRVTLGATRLGVLRELTAEHLLLAVSAGALGILLGVLSLELLIDLDAGRIPRLSEVSMDLGVLAFSLVVAAATTLLFGLAPALATLARAGRPDAGARTTDDMKRRRLRELFVASQLALALVLLTGAGLFSTSLLELRGVDLGLDPVNVASFRISLDPTEQGAQGTVQYYDALLERLAEIPGVLRVGAVQALPMNPVGNDFRRPYRASGSNVVSAEAPTVQMRIVSPGYIDAVGMRLVAGSGLPTSAAIGEPLVALVNQTLADRLWPDGDAIDATLEVDFRDGWQPYRVVGVVQDVKHYGPRTESLPEIFLSHRQVPYLAMNVVARTSGRPDRMTEALRSAVLSHRPLQPPYDFVSLEDLLSGSIAEERFLSVLLSLMGAVGLLLSSTGVYAVVAYAVGHRRREIGVRMAVGAAPARVVREILLGTVRMAALGLGLGLVTLAVSSGLIGGLLYGTSPLDVRAYLIVGPLLLGVSVLAAYVPARRAARADPLEALRPE